MNSDIIQKFFEKYTAIKCVQIKYDNDGKISKQEHIDCSKCEQYIPQMIKIATTKESIDRVAGFIRYETDEADLEISDNTNGYYRVTYDEKSKNTGVAVFYKK